MTFGETINERRKQLGLPQKELAARIRKEDGTSISPQYLNDLERDRRNPPSQHLLKEFARELKLPFEYLLFLVDELPGDLPKHRYAPEQVARAYKAFRQVLTEDDPQ